MKTRILHAAVMLATVSVAHAAESEKWPMVIPAPHGSVILPDQDAKWSYDNFRYAAVRRVDNTLYISGVVIGRRENEGRDAAAFKLQVDRGFQRLQELLKSAGATFNDVVMINSFHVWQGPNFAGTRDESTRTPSAVCSDQAVPLRSIAAFQDSALPPILRS